VSTVSRHVLLTPVIMFSLDTPPVLHRGTGIIGLMRGMTTLKMLTTEECPEMNVGTGNFQMMLK